MIDILFFDLPAHGCFRYLYFLWFKNSHNNNNINDYDSMTKKRSRLSYLHSPFCDINHCSYFEYITDIKQNSFDNRGVDIYF